MLNRRVDSPCCIAVLHRGVVSRCCHPIRSPIRHPIRQSDSSNRFANPIRQTDSSSDSPIRFVKPIRQSDSSDRFVKPIRQSDSSNRFQRCRQSGTHPGASREDIRRPIGCSISTLVAPKSSDSGASILANLCPWVYPPSYLKDNGGLKSGHYRLVYGRGNHVPVVIPADGVPSGNRDQQLISRGPCVCPKETPSNYIILSLLLLPLLLLLYYAITITIIDIVILLSYYIIIIIILYYYNYCQYYILFIDIFLLAL